MNRDYAVEAREGFLRSVSVGSVRGLGDALVATIGTPILVGGELLLIRSDRPGFIIVGVVIAGLHSMVVLYTLTYIMGMAFDVSRGLKGLPGRSVTWENVKRAIYMVEHSRMTKGVSSVLAVLNYANPLSAIATMVTHMAFEALTPHLRAEYLAEGGKDPESVSMFDAPDEDELPHRAEYDWRRYAATGTSRLLMPV